MPSKTQSSLAIPPARWFLIFSTLVALAACGSRTPSRSREFRAGIVGGQEVSISNSLSQSVAAVFQLQSQELCSAVFIQKDWLVSAAHCFFDADQRLVSARQVGVIFHSSSVMGDIRRNHFLSVDRIEIHPQFNPSQPVAGFDLALIHLARAANEALPVSLAEELVTSTAFVVSGFGENRNGDDLGVLKSVVLSRLSDDSYFQYLHLVSHEFLLGLENGSSGICNGDSGGPAFVRDSQSGQLKLVAITSGALQVNGARCSGASFYTLLLPHQNWMQRFLN